MPIMQGNKRVANVYNINNNSYSMPIGCIIPFSSNTIPAGFLLCDGSEVSKADYADLFAIIGNIYGAAIDTSKFKLPDLRDKFVQGANGNLGASKDAGLPNITGTFYHDTNAKTGLSGAFTYKDTGRQNLANDTSTNSGLVTFDASKSNSIYGNSNTVQPPAVCLNYIIKATNVSDIPIDTINIIDDTTTSATDKTYSANKINNMMAMFPFKWELIGTSSSEEGTTFKQTMSSGSPFCVYHSSGIFCFGNGIPANRGKLYGMTTGTVASVEYTAAGLLTVQITAGTAYIYEMKTI
jgi:microcystin-dependent protein